MMARCLRCQAKFSGDMSDALVRSHNHLLIAGVDPASSAKGADWTVFKVWDLDPPQGVAETVYTFTMDPGPRIQEVAAQMAAVGREIQGPVGYDRKSGIGHALEDVVIEMAPDIEIVGVGFDSREEKVRDVDFLKALVEGGFWRSHFHHQTKTQMMNWQVEDRAMVQDHLMCEVICGKVAQPYLTFYQRPDGSIEEHREPETGSDEGRYSGYDGGASRYITREEPREGAA